MQRSSVGRLMRCTAEWIAWRATHTTSFLGHPDLQTASTRPVCRDFLSGRVGVGKVRQVALFLVFSRWTKFGPTGNSLPCLLAEWLFSSCFSRLDKFGQTGNALPCFGAARC